MRKELGTLFNKDGEQIAHCMLVSNDLTCGEN